MAAGFDPAEAMARMRALAAARGGGSGRCALHVPRAPRLLLRAPPQPPPTPTPPPPCPAPAGALLSVSGGPSEQGGARRTDSRRGPWGCGGDTEALVSGTKRGLLHRFWRCSAPARR